MVIAHNLIAMNSQRQYNIVGDAKKKSTEKLSSGYRINRAADDAAGLAISEKMRRQVRGLNRASENILDGISYVQVADGALGEVQDMLQRMNSLAIKASSDTNTSLDRQFMDEEVKQLKGEIDRIFTNTTFNEQRIWDVQKIPVSSSVVVDTIVDDFPAVVFNTSSITSYTDNNNKGAVPKTVISFAADDDGIKASWTGYNGKTYTSENIPWDAQLAGKHSFKLSDYMDYSTYPEARNIDFTYNYTVNQYSSLDNVKAAINSSYSSLSTFITNTVSTQVSYVNDTAPKGISASASINYDAMLASGKTFEAYDTAFIEFNSMVNPAKADVPDSTPFSFKFDMPGIGSVTANVSQAYYRGDYNSNINDRTGEGLWWYEYRSSNGERRKSYITHDLPGGSLDSILYAVNNTDGKSLWSNNDSGGRITLSFNLNADTPYTKADGTTTRSVGDISFNFAVSKSNVSSLSDFEDYITNQLANFSSVDIYDNDGVTKGTVRIYKSSETKSPVKASHTYEKSETVYTYRTDNARDIYIQSGTEAGQGIHIKYDNMNSQLLGIEDTNVLTQESAGNAINQIKEALEKVSAQRSDFGAYQNRLEHSKMVDDNVAENTDAAESRIRDTDMAKEMIQFSMLNILDQAGVSMMSQANQNNQNVLSLLS